MRKYATAEILDARMATGRSPGLVRNAHRVSFDYNPREGYLYVRSRMISSRCNDNYDEFSHEAIKGDGVETGWHTFIGKPVFVNHHNDDHRRARGVIIDAALHEDRNGDGTPDTWVEGLMEVDAVRFPKLAKAILAGHIDRTSMGVDVAFSVCAVCNNKATTPLEYCQHIPNQKGRQHYRVTASGQRVGTLIREKCFGLRFFENSLLVEEPADPTAYFLGSVERGPGLEHLGMARTASRSISDFAYDVKTNVTRQFDRQTFNATVGHTASLAKFAHGGTCPACRGEDTIAMLGSAECLDCEHLYSPNGRAGRASVLHEAASKYRFVVKNHPDPGSHPIWNDIGASMQHIVDHYDQASDGEKRDGMRWYPDAQLLAHHIAKSSGSPMTPHKVAGVISAYSPKAEWSSNLHHAIRSIWNKRALTKGEGANIMDMHSNAAQRIMDGEDHQTVLQGPKTNAFAHNIEHGGMDPETGKPSHRVTVDTHAVSVMAGRRLSKEEKVDAASAIGHPHFYQHAQSLYQQAAAHVSARDGVDISPSQMQAITWGVRKRINDDDPEFKNKGNQTVERNNKARWRDYHKEMPNGGSDFATQSAEPGMRNLHAKRKGAPGSRRGRQ